MANLGTLDRASHFGLNGIANTIAQNAVRNGNEWDKLAALLGGYIGNRMGEHKRKKQEAKLDDIVNQAKANPNEPASVVDENGNIYGGNSPLSQDDYSYIMNGQQGEPVISGGVGDNLPTTSQEIVNASQAAATQKMPAANGGPAYNPNYNMDYIRQQARKQGISSGVLADREAEIQRDIAQSAEAYYLPQIQKKLYGSKDAPATTDSILEGMNMLNELGRYSPETAKAYQALAVGGLQGNQKFNQQKELAQINASNRAIADQRRLQNRIDYRNATQNTTKTLGKLQKNPISEEAYKNARTTMNGIMEAYPEGYNSYPPHIKQQFDTAATTAHAYDQFVKNNYGSQNVSPAQSVTPNNPNGARDVSTPDNKPAKDEFKNYAQNWLENLPEDTGDWNKMLDPEKGAFAQLINRMRGEKDEKGKARFSQDEINQYVLNIARQLPGWTGANNGELSYYDQLRRSLPGGMTDKERLHDVLYPEDPFKDIREFNSGKYDDSYGKALAAAYRNK